MDQLSDLRTDLRKKVGNPSATDVLDAELTDALNDAYVEIAMKFKFFKSRKLCTFDTVANQERYGLEDDAYAVLKVNDRTNGRPLNRMGITEYNARKDTTTQVTPGKPVKFIRLRGFLALKPVPDDVYLLEYLYAATPPRMIADSDIPVLPDAWQTGLVRLARAYYYDNRGDFPKWTAATASYNRWVATMPTELEEETEFTDNPVYVKSLAEGADRRKDFDHAD